MSRCFFVNKFPKISITCFFLNIALTILPFYATIVIKRSKMCRFFKLKKQKIQIFLEEYEEC